MSGYLPYLRDESIYIKEFYSVQRVHMPENHLSGRECYDFWELVYVIDGELNTNAGNAFYVLPKGSLILYEPLEFHTLDVREHQFADLFIMSFSVTGGYGAYHSIMYRRSHCRTFFFSSGFLCHQYYLSSNIFRKTTLSAQTLCFDGVFVALSLRYVH